MIAQSDGGPSGGEQRPGESMRDSAGWRRRIRDQLLWLGSVAAPGILVLLLYLIMR